MALLPDTMYAEQPPPVLTPQLSNPVWNPETNRWEMPDQSPTGAPIGVPGIKGAAVAKAGSSLFDIIFQSLLPTIGQLTGTGLQLKAGSDAAKEQARLTELALKDARDQRDYEHAQTAEDRRLAAEALGYGRAQTADQIAYTRAQKSAALQRFASYSAKLQPWMDRGNAAGDRMSQLLTTSTYQPQTAHTSIPGAEPMVRVKAPDGKVMDLSASDAQRALQLGAVRMG